MSGAMSYPNAIRRHTKRRLAVAAAALSCLMPLAGCDSGLALGDPTARAGTWMPTGDNDANLRVMVADPHDLVVGKAAPNALAAEAAPPVGLLLSGRRQALPSAGDMSPGGGGGGGGGSGGGSGATQGGGNAGAQ